MNYRDSEMHRLIDECRPPVVFGEQVGTKAGRAWLAGSHDKSYLTEGVRI